jgi:hypothetical protein
MITRKSRESMTLLYIASLTVNAVILLRKGSKMKKTLITLCIVCMLWAQGCSTIKAVGGLMQGIGQDVAGLSDGVKNQIKEE